MAATSIHSKAISDDSCRLPRRTSERYQLLEQLPACCVPACLQMVFRRHGIREQSQEAIGKELGLVVPPSVAGYFKDVEVSRTAPESGYGTRIKLEEFSLNAFFRRHELPLHYRYVPFDTISDVKGWLSRKLREGRDVLACFDPDVLDGRTRSPHGHVGLIDSVDGNCVSLVNPDEDRTTLITVKMSRLQSAMKARGKSNLGGFWVLKFKGDAE